MLFEKFDVFALIAGHIVCSNFNCLISIVITLPFYMGFTIRSVFHMTIAV